MREVPQPAITRQKATCWFLLFLLALAACLAACSRDPNIRKHKYFASGEKYFDKGKYAEAAIEFRNALNIDPNYSEAHQQLGETYLKLQQGDRAVQEFARTVELQPDNFQARLELANLLILGRDFEHAQEHIKFLQQQRPNDAAVHSLISSSLAAQDDIPGAIAEMEKTIALDPRRWEPRLSLALLQLKNNQPDAAEMNFKKVIELNPSAVHAYLMLGSYYQSRGRFADAEQQLQHSVNLEPKNPDLHAALARLYLAEGKKTQAEALLQQAKRDLADNPAGYRLLADFYFVTGDVEKALSEYSALSQQHPKDLSVRKNYIQLLIQTHRFDEARKLTADILKAHKDDADALVFQSEMQISDGNVSEAIKTLESVIKNDPNNSEAHYVLGTAFEKSGSLDRAISEWSDALRLRPNFLDAQR